MEQYRSSVTDALGQMIPDQGPLRIFLDDDTVDRRAPDGWLHLVTAREVCFLLASGRVVALSLDNDLSDDIRFGQGKQVVDFLAEHPNLFPREGLTIHSANPAAREQMSIQLSRLGARQDTSAGKPCFYLG